MNFIAVTVYLLTATLCLGDEHRDHMLKEAPNIDLGKTLPEDYDWLTYIEGADSVSDEMSLLGLCFLREAPQRAIGSDRRAGSFFACVGRGTLPPPEARSLASGEKG